MPSRRGWPNATTGRSMCGAGSAPGGRSALPYMAFDAMTISEAERRARGATSRRCGRASQRRFAAGPADVTTSADASMPPAARRRMARACRDHGWPDLAAQWERPVHPAFHLAHPPAPEGEQGEMQDEQGEMQDEQGEMQDEQGEMQDEQGEMQDEQGEMQDEQGEMQDEQGEMQDEQGEMQDEQGEMQDEQGEMQDEQGEMQDEQGEMQDEQGEMQDEQGEMQDEQGEMQDEQGEMQDEQGEMQDKQGEMQDEQGETPCRYIPGRGLVPSSTPAPAPRVTVHPRSRPGARARSRRP